MKELLHLRYPNKGTFFILLEELEKIGYSFINFYDDKPIYIEEYNTWTTSQVYRYCKNYRHILIEKGRNRLLFSDPLRFAYPTFFGEKEQENDLNYVGILDFTAVFTQETRDMLINNIKEK